MSRRRVLATSIAAALSAALVHACASNGGAPAFVGDGGADGGDAGADATISDTSFGRDAPHEIGLSEASLSSDGSPDVEGGACLPPEAGDAGPAPYAQRCVASTGNECDGVTDMALSALGAPAALLNGRTGNGFDDNCNGLVDEGCDCPSNGQTKDCYLVPATQVDPATRVPVGWCTQNSLGSVDCVGTELPTWSGVCRGASPPYAHDICAPGDFNCDGLQENDPFLNCTCGQNIVTCPSTVLIEPPYPDPTSLPAVSGAQWINGAAALAATTNWSWTVLGGDCDNVLPNPTFAIYAGADSTTAPRIGLRTPVLYDSAASPARYVATMGAPVAAIQAAAFGNGAPGATVYPAFGLSGDYLVQGEWDFEGQHYACVQKVAVRAPGVRAELCWDTVGGTEAVNPAGNDLDLHFLRLQGVSCPTKGWDTTCPEGQTYEDCFWNFVSGCRSESPTPPGWGYADSPASACTGWSSKRVPVNPSMGDYQGCTNPRLDKDDSECDKTVTDPTAFGSATGFNAFCGPENINLDDPNDGDMFAVAVNDYANHGGTTNAHPHVNVYCNGERILSAGYNPATAQTSYPLETNPGQDKTGDYWEVGIVTVHTADGGAAEGGTNGIACSVATVPSHHADQVRDGVTSPTTAGNALCVDSTMSAANPPYDYASHALIENVAVQGDADGGIPAGPAGFCKH